MTELGTDLIGITRAALDQLCNEKKALESENAAHKKLEDVRVRAYAQEVNSLLTRAEKSESENERLREALKGERLKVLAEIHAYQTRRMWDGAISFMKKDIPDYELAIRGGTNV